MARLESLRARIALNSKFLVIFSCGFLLTKQVKFPEFQNKARWYSIDQKFYADGEKTMDSNFEPLRDMA
jgi:hypothetical protein